MKIIISLCFMLLTNLCLFAQQPAVVKLDIIFNHIQNITVNPAQTVTTLAYNTQADFENGVDTLQKEHLNVFSTGPYVIKVGVASQEFSLSSGSGSATLKNPAISVSAVMFENTSNILLEKAVLSTSSQPLITSGQGSFNQSFDVRYHGPGGNVFMDYIINNERTSYSNMVLYTIETK